MNEIPRIPKPGETWIGFNCLDCKNDFIIWHDPSGGKLKIATDKDKPATFKTVCPHCKKWNTYLFEKLIWVTI